jgi:putative acetyltransferase
VTSFCPTPVTLRDGSRVEIRAAAPDDAPAGLEFSEDLHTNDAGHLLTEPDEFDRDLETYRERLQKSHDDPRSIHLFAWSDDTVVADAMFVGGSKRRVRHSGWLGLGVRPAWQGRGLGRSLMTVLLDWASGHGDIERVSLRVFTDNARALPLYESFGFVNEGSGLRAFKLGEGRYADEHCMCLFVKPGVAPPGFNTYHPGSSRAQ